MAVDVANVVWKLHWAVLPICCIMVGFCYLDRSNVAYMQLQLQLPPPAGMSFSSSLYGNASGFFFIGYSVFQIPSNIILVRPCPPNFQSFPSLTACINFLMSSLMPNRCILSTCCSIVYGPPAAEYGHHPHPSGHAATCIPSSSRAIRTAPLLSIHLLHGTTVLNAREFSTDGPRVSLCLRICSLPKSACSQRHDHRRHTRVPCVTTRDSGARVPGVYHQPEFQITLQSHGRLVDGCTAPMPCHTPVERTSLPPATGTAAAASCIHHAGSVALADNCTDRCTPACLFTPRTHPQAAQFTCNLHDLALHALQHQPHPNRSICGSVVPTSSQHHPLPTIAPSSATPSPHHNLGSRGSSAAEPSCMQMT